MSSKLCGRFHFISTPLFELVICIEKHFHEWRIIKSNQESCERSKNTVLMQSVCVEFLLIFPSLNSIEITYAFVGMVKKKKSSGIDSNRTKRCHGLVVLLAFASCAVLVDVNLHFIVKLQEM
jgi:hypothetical protein